MSDRPLNAAEVAEQLASTPFYYVANNRRREVILGSQKILIWDAETLSVFKMMFFRRKDIADVEQILREQHEQFDASWVRERLVEIYGERDPRVSQWDELIEELRNEG